jgi:hypothetical protein
MRVCRYAVRPLTFNFLLFVRGRCAAAGTVAVESIRVPVADVRVRVAGGDAAHGV